MQQAPFDAYAEGYDTHFTNSPIGRMQRERVHRFFKRFVKTKKNILEINCGTGEDAVWMARAGHSVLATDMSKEMLNQAEKKKHIRKIDNLELQHCAFKDLHTLKTKPFDLIFSNFGGLNCVSKDELKQLSDDFSNLLLPKGRLVLVIMGRKCKWERSYFKKKKENEKAKRRMSEEGIKTMISGCSVETWYYSPKEIIRIFAANFNAVNTKPVGLFIPPSYLNNYFGKKKITLNILNLLEKLFGEFSVFSDYADHYFIILEKK
ncbi:MAG: methyltransferase domain-containing protein [Bacteroidia bacterium]|nr:methyltransferase domain-containing protein [Bacteroidia bacterium]